MSGPFKTTVDACIEWLGDQVETIARDPRQTLLPTERGRYESWERAEALLADRLTGQDPLVMGATLGQGGEGIIHEAEQRSLGRLVAVKTLRPAVRTPTAALSLLREAWILGRLEHPNILPIHDLRRDEGGMPRAVLKRIEGTVWEDVVADAHETRARFGADLFEHNLEVLLQVCQAVRFAHSRGVVHRDLKPGNVMIGAFGEVYLLDWGIAVVVDDVAGLPRTELDGTIAGTPSYMAPEMLGVGGATIEKATDVYLLGAVLYEICVGLPPHEKGDGQRVVASIVGSPPAIPDTVPVDLAALMRQAMLPDPDERPSLEAFRQGLLDHRRHVASADLVTEAMVKLERLEVDAETGLEEAYDLFGACRFGFQQALEIWPDNRGAREGLRRAGCAIVRHELRRGDVEAARAQLEAIDDPPEELRRELQDALADHSAERERIAALEHVGDQYDAGTGRDVRLFVAFLLALVWAISPLVAIVGEHYGYAQRVPGVVAPLSYSVLLGIAYLRYRKVIHRTVFNRRTIAFVAIALSAILIFAYGAVAMGLGRQQMRALQLLLCALASAGAALALHERLWIPTLGYALGFLASARVFTGMVGTLLAQAAGHGVLAATVFFMWRKPPANTAERYGVGR